MKNPNYSKLSWNKDGFEVPVGDSSGKSSQLINGYKVPKNFKDNQEEGKKLARLGYGAEIAIKSYFGLGESEVGKADIVNGKHQDFRILDKVVDVCSQKFYNGSFPVPSRKLNKPADYLLCAQYNEAEGICILWGFVDTKVLPNYPIVPANTYKHGKYLLPYESIVIEKKDIIPFDNNFYLAKELISRVVSDKFGEKLSEIAEDFSDIPEHIMKVANNMNPEEKSKFIEIYRKGAQKG